MAMLSLPLVSDLETMLSFNQSFVHEEPPEGAILHDGCRTPPVRASKYFAHFVSNRP